MWFGSTGLYHKGLDILLDVFAQLPECTLNVYGVNQKEWTSLKKIIPQNVIVHSKVYVQSRDFLDVVKSNLFIISVSCSEAMQSGIATGMRHGLIPLITEECGYDDHPAIIKFKDYRVGTIKEKIEEVGSWDDHKLATLSDDVYEYANSCFTLHKFVETFETIVSKIIR